MPSLPMLEVAVFGRSPGVSHFGLKNSKPRSPKPPPSNLEAWIMDHEPLITLQGPKCQPGPPNCAFVGNVYIVQGARNEGYALNLKPCNLNP